MSFLNKFKSYLEIINSLNELNLKDSNFLFRKIDKISNNYFKDSKKIDHYVDKFSDELVESLPFDLDHNAIYLLLFELLNNIFKHSMFNDAFVLCQFAVDSDKIGIFVFDDGLSIPKSLRNSGKKFTSDSEAIFNAINGTSSDKEKEKLKGRGLNMSANVVTFGFGEELFIASGNGLCCINQKGISSYENICPFIDGTLLCLKINTNKINIYKYTAFKEFEKFY